MIERAELAAWLRLLETPQVGRESARRLLAAFGSPEAAISASAAARRQVIGPVQAAALGEEPEGFEALVDATSRWLDGPPDERRRILTLGDPLYPPALLDTADPPLLLYLSGDAALLGQASLAIVGSRNPTPQGAANARAFARHLAGAGIVIVSGLALGVDGEAHQGALDAGGRTIAVIGTGIDRVYPSRHRVLAHRIVREGLIVSEYKLGTQPLAPNFPLRNRVIAGLSRGTLVVEAALQSGSLITARLASEAGRDVFAIPGSIHSPQSRGCHALLKQGAKLVETAQDVLEELQLTPEASLRSQTPSQTPAPAPSTASPADALLDALGHDPVSLDALEARTGWSASELNIRLLDLELSGDVARLPGQLFQRVVRG